MPTKQPTSPPLPRIRVCIMGDHPWNENFGWIEPKDGGYETIMVLGAPPTMYKINLDNGESCFAERKHIKRIEQPTSPPPPRKRR